ncbi:latent membrane protein [Weissella oryzae SG25]|uniref:Latent membrane protein n=1 Tax=Weissella oryzae (strain DSM 25784 / JCM 18191 / LMG 30913 / SG25) TaxID=1329250 RepID=A0A069CSF1_WEIOS|nr:latent membrane protein [Weissella oryzae SG25]
MQLIKKKLYIIIPTIIIFTLFFVIVVFAKDDNTKTLANYISMQNMTQIAKNIEIMQLYHEPTGITHPLATVNYALSGFFWSFNTIAYSLFDYLLNVLFNTSSMDPIITFVADLSKGLYKGLAGSILKSAFLAGMVISIIMYFTKGKSAAYKQVGSILFILLFQAIWFTHVTPILQDVNSLADNLSANIATSISKISTGKNDDTFAEMASDTSENKTTTVNAIRTSYFDQSYYTSWRLAEYGTASDEDNNKINEANKLLLTDKTLSDDEVKEVLANDKLDKNFKDKMSKNNSMYQLMISSMSGFVSVLYGVPYVFLGLINWVVTILAFAIATILPILAVMSMFPKYGTSFTNGVAKMVLYMLARGVVLLGLVLFSISHQIIVILTQSQSGNMTGVVGGVGMLVGAVLNFILLYLVWKNKKVLTSTLSGGHIDFAPMGDALSRKLQNMKNVPLFSQYDMDRPTEKDEGSGNQDEDKTDVNNREGNNPDTEDDEDPVLEDDEPDTDVDNEGEEGGDTTDSDNEDESEPENDPDYEDMEPENDEPDEDDVKPDDVEPDMSGTDNGSDDDNSYPDNSDNTTTDTVEHDNENPDIQSQQEDLETVQASNHDLNMDKQLEQDMQEYSNNDNAEPDEDKNIDLV